MFHKYDELVLIPVLNNMENINIARGSFMIGLDVFISKQQFVRKLIFT